MENEKEKPKARKQAKKKADQRQLLVILKRGIAGKVQKQKQIVRGLGLRRTGHSVILNDTPAIRGMIRKVIHLVDYEEI